MKSGFRETHIRSSKKTCRYIQKSCQKGFCLAPDCSKLISRLNTFPGEGGGGGGGGWHPPHPRNRVPLIFREKHFRPLTPLTVCYRRGFSGFQGFYIVYATTVSCLFYAMELQYIHITYKIVCSHLYQE